MRQRTRLLSVTAFVATHCPTTRIEYGGSCRIPLSFQFAHGRDNIFCSNSGCLRLKIGKAWNAVLYGHIQPPNREHYPYSKRPYVGE